MVSPPPARGPDELMARCDRNFASGAAWEEQPGIDDLRTAPRGAVRGE